MSGRCPFCGSTDLADTMNDKVLCMDCEKTWVAGGKKRQRKRTAAGFTLIELLVVVIIVGVVASIVIFAIGEYQRDGAIVNMDPRQGWVVVDDTLDKRCDGTTMLYRNTDSGAYTTSAHHEECEAQ